MLPDVLLPEKKHASTSGGPSLLFHRLRLFEKPLVFFLVPTTMENLAIKIFRTATMIMFKSEDSKTSRGRV
jgi:hypothetical protein